MDEKDLLGRTPLICAAWNGHADVVKLLLQHRANPASTDDNGNTALIEPAYRGYDKIVKMLVDAKAPLNSTDIHGLTPLYYSISGKNPICAEILLLAGADRSEIADLDIFSILNSAEVSFFDEVTFLY